MTPVAPGRKDVRRETRRRIGQVGHGLLGEAGLDSPPDEVMTSRPAMASTVPGHTPEHVAAGVQELLRDLQPDWPLPTTRTRPGGNACWIP